MILFKGYTLEIRTE